MGVVAATFWTISACWRDVRGSADGLLGASAGGSQRGVSATVTPASSVRCNRIKLPARLRNETTGPYNPAAARHPVTGEWLLLHTLDEVQALRLAQHGVLCADRRTLQRLKQSTKTSGVSVLGPVKLYNQLWECYSGAMLCIGQLECDFFVHSL